MPLTCLSAVMAVVSDELSDESSDCLRALEGPYAAWLFDAWRGQQGRIGTWLIIGALVQDLIHYVLQRS